MTAPAEGTATRRVLRLADLTGPQAALVLFLAAQPRKRDAPACAETAGASKGVRDACADPSR